MLANIHLLKKLRDTSVRILDKYSLEELNYIPTSHNNNIIWNIAHTLSVQQSLTYGLSGLRWTSPKELVKAYSRGTAPVGDVDDDFVDFLREELISSADTLYMDYQDGIFEDYKEFETATGYTIRTIDDAIRFNIFHEGLHLGTVVSLQKLLPE